MESPGEAAYTYRLIITRRDASEIILLPNGSGWALPSVAIRPHHRVAGQLTTEVTRVWGLEAYCLFHPSYSIFTRSEGPKCMVMESVRQNDKGPAEIHWMPVPVAKGCVDACDAEFVRQALDELDCYKRGEKCGPFARPGWLKELCQWIQEQLAPLRLQTTGKFQQLHASSSFSLIRMETTGPAVWFKATSDPNRHELPVSLSLAHLFPLYVPAIIGVQRSWNAWLSMEAVGAPLDSVEKFSQWERVAIELAQFQIASIGRVAELLENGCKDFRLSKVALLVDPFLAEIAELMTAQQKQEPAPLSKPEIDFLGDRLKDAFALLAETGLPDTIGHLDFNPANIVVAPNRCTFLDWSEGCIANPLLTLEYLLEHFKRSHPQNRSGTHRIAVAYRRCWHACFPEEVMARAMGVTPMIAVFFYGVALSQSPVASLSDPRQAGFQRSLARRMFREATHWAARRVA